MKIGVSGKGGVGKTLVAGVLAHFFVEKGYRVLAIDADPTPNLAYTLGVSPDEAEKIQPVSENQQLLKDKTDTSFPGVYRLTFKVSDIVRDFAVDTSSGVSLLVMGTVRDAGAGCTCPANAVVRELLRHLIVERDEVVILDMEAGVEHMGRGTAKNVDVMLVVADSSLKALKTAKKIAGLAGQTGIRKVFLIGNRVSDQEEGEAIKSYADTHSIRLLDLIPQDRQIAEADRLGVSPLTRGETSEGVQVIRSVGEKLVEKVEQ